jgi:hypothetical protein
MYSFKDYMLYPILNEDLHPELKDKSDNLPQFLKKKKELEKRGEDTGLSGEAHAGSSRVYMPHSGTHKIMLDGKEAHVPIGTKFAKKFALDAHTGDDRSLGAQQNEAESDAALHHGIFRKHGDGSYTTNPHGVVAPVVDHHDEHEHITSVRCDKFSAAKFKECTVNKDYPKGLSYKHFHGALMREHDLSNGKSFSPASYGAKSHEELDKAAEHPLTEKFLNHMHDTGHHPGDVRPANLGILHHPHTGEKHVALLDAGYDHNVQASYNRARTNQMKSNLRW